MPPRAAEIALALSIIAPRLPAQDRDAVLYHAQESRGLSRASPQAAAWLSLTAYARHEYSDYDDLLADGYDQDQARHFCQDQINAVLEEWGCRLRVGDGSPSGDPSGRDENR